MKPTILRYVSCFLLGSLGLLCSDSNGQQTPMPSTEKVTTRFRMKLRMDDQKIAMLKASGSLRTTVPKAFRNTIDGIKMHRDFSFITDEFVADDHVEKRGTTLLVKLTDEMLDRLDYQPLLNKVYFSNFSDVLLVYVKPKNSPTEQAGSAKQTGEDSPKFFAKIDEFRGIYGSIDRDFIKMKTSFGSVDIDVAKIEGIRFHDGNSISVWLSRQDRISGTIDFDELTMQCSWGEQKLKVDDLETLTLKRDTLLPNIGILTETSSDAESQPPVNVQQRSKRTQAGKTPKSNSTISKIK